MDDPTFTVLPLDILTQEILLAATNHDVEKLRELIALWPEDFEDIENFATNVQDPDTRYSPLHAAIAACEDDQGAEKENLEPIVNAGANNEVTKSTNQSSFFESAKQTVEYLLSNGAIWNLPDNQERTPGCIALKLGERGKNLYDVMVRAGTMAELIRNRAGPEIEGFVKLCSNDGHDVDGEGETDENGSEAAEEEIQKLPDQDETYESEKVNKQTNGFDTEQQDPLSNQRYLSTPLTSTKDALLDAHKNGVMMSWETSIMQRTADHLLYAPGLRILNVGFGMGIFDTYVQSHANSPAEHHIIEAHPDVLTKLRQEGWYDVPGVIIHEGTWQDVSPQLRQSGTAFDAIFFDTFAESYAAFREFFSKHVVKLLRKGEDARWSFFNGMGADRRIVYDVYQGVVVGELANAGWRASFEEVDVPKEILEDEKEWEGVKRRYWVIEEYRIPIVRRACPRDTGQRHE